MVEEAESLLSQQLYMDLLESEHAIVRTGCLHHRQEERAKVPVEMVTDERHDACQVFRSRDGGVIRASGCFFDDFPRSSIGIH